MSLKELLGDLEEEVTITLKKKVHTIKVKPLSLSAISELLSSNKKELSDLFNGVKSMKEILIEMPNLAYKVIAMATGEITTEISLLPIGTQLQLLEKVVDVSQISSDAVGKLISRLVRGVQTILPEASTLMNGNILSQEHLDKSLEKATALET